MILVSDTKDHSLLVQQRLRGKEAFQMFNKENDELLEAIRRAISLWIVHAIE